MGSPFEETIFDFDLNFLQQSPNVVNDCKLDKQKKAVLLAKKKTVATDSLIRKYYGNKEQLEQTEIVLLAAKEECKQVCIDYKESLEKCAQLEKDLQLLKNENKELESNCVLAQSQVEGMKSHAHQLQMLVKEHETAIEGLKVENQLEKNNFKDNEKNLLNLQKENETLLNDLCILRDIVLGKKKLRSSYKSVLQKYEKVKSIKTHDAGSESSCEEDDLFDSVPPSPLSPYESKHQEHEVKSNEILVKKDVTRLNDDSDSVFSNEIVSEDTGRGSSLAFSDGEKCFNSPDYFCNDSPLDCNKIKSRKVYVDACTSPTMVHAFAHIATSPILFDDEALLSDDNTIALNKTDSNSTEYFITDIPISTEIVTIKERKQLVDVATNTFIVIEKLHKSTSPVAFEELDVRHKNLIHTATSPIETAQDSSNDNIIVLSDVNIEIERLYDSVETKITEDAVTDNESKHTTDQSSSSTCELKIISRSQEKECLEINNSTKLCNENSNDCEIEMILNSMRLTDEIITPIPKTPINLNKKSTSKQSPVKQSSAFKEHNVCPEAMKLREENKTLQASVANLSKEVMNIKCILKKQFLMPENSEKQLCENMNKHVVNSETFDHSSQQEILKNYDSEQNNNHMSDEEICVTSNTPEESIATQEVICQTRKDTESLTASQVENSKEILNKEENIVVRNITRDDKEDSPLLDSRESVVENLWPEVDDIGNNEKEYVVIIENKHKNVKCKKLSKLDRFKKKLLPKNKIKQINAPIRKLRSKAKPVLIKSRINGAEILLNNKSAYEKAVKVLAELKLKKLSDKKESSNGKVKKVGTDIEKSENKECNNNRVNLEGKSNEEDLNDISIIKQPYVDLSGSKLRKNEEKEKLQKDIMTTSPKKSECSISNADSPTRSLINTRSRSKTKQYLTVDVDVNNAKCKGVVPMSEVAEEISSECNKLVEGRRRLKRVASDDPFVESKRILRSEKARKLSMNHTNVDDTILNMDDNPVTLTKEANTKLSLTETNKNIHKLNRGINKPGDENEVSNLNINTEQNTDVVFSPCCHPKDSILCKVIGKFGKVKIKYSAQKIPDNISDNICKKLGEDIKKIIKLSADEAKTAMNKLVEEIQQNWNLKSFQVGFMKYLKDPARKQELFNKVSTPPAPPMTKSEQVLLFIIRQLQILKPNTLNVVLTQIEFSLFQLNKSPEFDVIESLSHFYALLCRYFGLKNRLRMFLLDAMYCLQFKVVPLIKHCLDVWMHILPLAHMGIAKTPLVTCLVYLLHFYKCEDKLNRIQDLRFILNKKYFYQLSDWNETKILDMFRNSIKELRDIKLEKKMLRMAFIILAKRQGPKWCQKNIIKNMLMPMIEKEDTPIRIKQFCIEMLGPLMKPYPVDMKLHCEIIVNQLLNMLDENAVDSLKEAIFTSLIYMNKHNQSRVNRGLLSWSPKHVSSEFEELLRDYVQERNIKAWKTILSRLTL